jgi:hypothetical protein
MDGPFCYKEINLEGEVENSRELLQAFVDIQEKLYRDVKNGLPA